MIIDRRYRTRRKRTTKPSDPGPRFVSKNSWERQKNHPVGDCTPRELPREVGPRSLVFSALPERGIRNIAERFYGRGRGRSTPRSGSVAARRPALWRDGA